MIAVADTMPPKVSANPDSNRIKSPVAASARQIRLRNPTKSNASNRPAQINPMTRPKIKCTNYHHMNKTMVFKLVHLSIRKIYCGEIIGAGSTWIRTTSELRIAPCAALTAASKAAVLVV